MINSVGGCFMMNHAVVTKKDDQTYLIEHDAFEASGSLTNGAALTIHVSGDDDSRYEAFVEWLIMSICHTETHIANAIEEAAPLIGLRDTLYGDLEEALSKIEAMIEPYRNMVHISDEPFERNYFRITTGPAISFDGVRVCDSKIHALSLTLESHDWMIENSADGVNFFTNSDSDAVLAQMSLS